MRTIVKIDDFTGTREWEHFPQTSRPDDQANNSAISELSKQSQVAAVAMFVTLVIIICIAIDDGTIVGVVCVYLATAIIWPLGFEASLSIFPRPNTLDGYVASFGIWLATGIILLLWIFPGLYWTVTEWPDFYGDDFCIVTLIFGGCIGIVAGFLVPESVIARY